MAIQKCSIFPYSVSYRYYVEVLSYEKPSNFSQKCFVFPAHFFTPYTVHYTPYTKKIYDFICTYQFFLVPLQPQRCEQI